MSRSFTIGCTLAAVVGLAAITEVGIAANGSSMSSAGASMSAPEASPAEMARDSYNSGISHRDNGKKYEEQALTQQPKDQAKTLQKATDEFTKALKDFKKAIDLDPTLYQAYNGMGYALRKTGDYTNALLNYDKALQLSPGFPDAMEYRGEAYLGLNRVDDAKQSYLTLFGTDRKQADALLKAMTAWVAKHQTEPGGVDPAVVLSLDSWVKERTKIASTTASMAVSDSRSVWK